MPLLLDVRVEIVPEKERALNDWYYHHVPRLVSVPGYESGRRYVAMTPGPRYAALYEIRDDSYVASLVGEDHSLRHPLTLSEWVEWDRNLAPYMSHESINLYECRSELLSPILHDSEAIIEIRFDVRDHGSSRSARECVTQCLASVVFDVDVISAAALTASQHPSAGWLSTSPSDLLLIECRSARSAEGLVTQAGVVQNAVRMLESQAGVCSLEVLAYRQIARHWPWFKEEDSR